MFTKNSSKLLVLIGIAVIALVTVSIAAVPKASQSYPDYAQRHPGGLVIPASTNLDTRGSDYFQRHPELTRSSVMGIGASDYFQRHPELTTSVLGIGASDYFQRHAELTISILGLDASDYFMRHPELIAPAEVSVDMTDYFFRHPGN